MDIITDNSNKLRIYSNGKHLDPSYLAGFVDGDGCIYIRKQTATKKGTNDYFQAGVEISQSRTNVLQVIALHYGGKLYSMKRAETHRTEYTLRLAGKNADIFLKDIKDCLVIKHKQAELVLKINEMNNKHKLFKEKDVLYKECELLNLKKTAELKLDRVNEAFVAGMFDAEGFCGLRKNKKTGNTKGLRIKITQMSYPDILTKIRDVIGFGKVVTESDGNTYWKTEKISEANKLFKIVTPHIIVKFNQTIILSKYTKSDKFDIDFRNKLYEELSSEKHQSETLSPDFNLDYTIYINKLKIKQEKAKQIKEKKHTTKIKKQYKDKSEKMKGEGNWNYGKERSLEHSFKISSSKRKDQQTFEQYKLEKEKREKEKEMRSKLKEDELKVIKSQKISISKRKVTANELIKVLNLACEGLTIPSIVAEIKKINSSSKITQDSVKNIRMMKTKVFPCEAEYDEYIEAKNNFITNKDKNTLKNKNKAIKNSNKNRKTPVKVIIKCLQMYSEKIGRKKIIEELQKLYPDVAIAEHTVKRIRSGKTKVLEIEPEYSEYKKLMEQF